MRTHDTDPVWAEHDVPLRIPSHLTGTGSEVPVEAEQHQVSREHTQQERKSVSAPFIVKGCFGLNEKRPKIME